MADYDRNRDEDRFGRGNRGRDGSYRQEEQFSDYSDGQYGDTSRYDGDTRSGSGFDRDGYRGRDRSSGGGQYRGSDHGNRGYQGRDRYSGYSGSDRHGSDRFSDASHDRTDYGRGSGASFGGNDYGRSGYGQSSYDRADYDRGSSRESYRGGYGSEYDSSRRSDRSSERGFFEKAGDEVASWFGDEDAERRRRMDHRGRGPVNYERSNERLLEEACERLTNDWGVDASQINVTADNNEITLDGTVDSRSAKRRAEDCVHDISGVRHVQNNLRVSDGDRYGSYSGTGSTGTGMSTGTSTSLSGTGDTETA